MWRNGKTDPLTLALVHSLFFIFEVPNSLDNNNNTEVPWCHINK